jgi:hypothetical protein
VHVASGVHVADLVGAFGVDTAKWICVSAIDVTQLGVAAYLYAGLHQTTYAAVLLGLILPQVHHVFSCHFILGLLQHLCASPRAAVAMCFPITPLVSLAVRLMLIQACMLACIRRHMLQCCPPCPSMTVCKCNAVVEDALLPLWLAAD